MYYFKKFKTREFEILGGLTWKWTWTLGLQIHWSWVTKKDDPKLAENGFFMDFHILCFSFDFHYWWGQE